MLPLLVATALLACKDSDTVDTGEGAPTAGFHGPWPDAGYSHACAIDEGGDVWCWGDTEEIGAEFEGTTWAAVSAGWGCTCALDPSGLARCWSAYERQPLDVAESVATVEALANVACGLSPAGVPWCVGMDGGDVEPDITGTFVTASFGDLGACGIDASGDLTCGGTPDLTEDMPGDGPYVQVGVGADIACALAESGRIDCWGDSSYLVPYDTERIYAALSVGFAHACALDVDGELLCWGPSPDDGETWVPWGDFAYVAAGAGFTCATEVDGTLACWGANDEGQATPPRSRPGAAPPPRPAPPPPPGAMEWLAGTPRLPEAP